MKENSAIMGKHSASPPIRIVAELPEECRVNPLLQRVWVLLPRHLRTVADLAAYLEDKYVQLDDGISAAILLEIGGVPVAPHEDIAIIRDSDTIRVRVQHLTSELPAIEGPAEILAIEGPQNPGAQSLEGKRERKKKKRREKGESEGEGQGVFEVDPGREKKRKRKESDTEEGPRGGLMATEALEGNHGLAGSLRKGSDAGKKRNKISEDEDRRGARAAVEGQLPEKSPELKRKKRGKGGDNTGLGREEAETLLQLEWVREAATAGKGVGPGLAGLPDEKLTGGVLKEGKRKNTKEAEAGDGDGRPRSARQPPEGEKAEPTAPKTAAAREATEAVQEDSSSDSESGGEAPRKEKKTPSRSARRKAAKRRYARLAKEAAAAGDTEAVTSGMGDTRARHDVSSGLPAVEEHRSVATGEVHANGPAASQHVLFGDSDGEEGAQATRAADGPPIVLHVGLGASGQPLSKERGKEWGLQKGRKRDRYKSDTWQQKTGWAEVPPPEPTAAEITGKSEKGAEEFQRKRTAEEYERLPDLGRAPQVADVLAYRLVELTSSWTPQISEYREGRVTAFDAASGTVSLAWWPAEDLVARKESVAQLDGEDTEPAFAPPYDEDGNLEIDLGSLMGVKLVQASDVTLAQLPGAPPVPATTPRHFTSEWSPSSVLPTGEADNESLAVKGGEKNGSVIGGAGKDGVEIGEQGRNESAKRGGMNDGLTQGSGGIGDPAAENGTADPGKDLTGKEYGGKRDEGVSVRLNALSGSNAVRQIADKAEKGGLPGDGKKRDVSKDGKGGLTGDDRKGEREEREQAQGGGLEAERSDLPPADVSRASAPAEYGGIAAIGILNAPNGSGTVAGSEDLGGSKATGGVGGFSDSRGLAAAEGFKVLNEPQRSGSALGVGGLGEPKGLAVAEGGQISGEPRGSGAAGGFGVSGGAKGLAAAGGVGGLGGPKGLGPTPPAWQAWESVAQLLARRRAEIAEQARKREAERKREEERKREKAGNQEEARKGEEEEEAGRLEEALEQEVEYQERELRKERGAEGGGERKAARQVGEGARKEGHQANMECEAAVAENMGDGTEEKKEEKGEPGNRKEQRKGEEKEAEASGALGQRNTANGFGGTELDIGLTEAASSGLRCEANGKATEGMAERKETGPVERDVRSGAKAGDLMSGLLLSAALDVARKTAVESGNAPDARDLKGKTEGNKAKTGIRPATSGVGPRGVTKPRAPRLGALGPTLAYLRLQTNELQ